MGKNVKSRRTSRLSLTKNSIIRRPQKKAKISGKKPSAPPQPAVDVEEMLESSIISTNDGSIRTRSGLMNGEAVQQRSPSRRRAIAGAQKEPKASSDLENKTTESQSPPTRARSLRVRMTNFNPEKVICRIRPSVPLTEENVVKDQMTLQLQKIDEPQADQPNALFEKNVKIECESFESVCSVKETSSSNELDLSESASIEDILKSPSRSKYLLKQLESSLSPKFTKPNETGTGMPTSRYGRIQKQKQNNDYIPIDVAKFVTKSPVKPLKIKPKTEVVSTPEPTKSPPEESNRQPPVEVQSEDPPKQDTTELPVKPDTFVEPSVQVEPSLPIETSHPSEPIPPLIEPATAVVLTDQLTSDEALPIEVVPANDTETSTPVVDTNASLLGIDQIQIIDMDASFGDTVISPVPNSPVIEEEIEPPQVDPQEPPSEPDPVIDVPPAEQSIVSTEHLEYQPGQLLWGAFNSKSVHWPCIVSPDPEDGRILKVIIKKSLLHVRFFADNGRRAWISVNQVLPYSTAEQYQALVDTQFKPLRSKLVSLLRRGIWIEAVRQANDTEKQPIELREKRYNELLEQDLKKPKTVRRRTKSLSLGYHSNSLDESFDSSGGRKRERSRTPESPAYEALPVSSKNGENLAKRIKIEPNDQQDQDLFRSKITHYFQSMADGSDMGETVSSTSSECEEVPEMVDSDKDIYSNFLNISRLYVFEGQTETGVEKKLQKYVQKICALRLQSAVNGARLSNRLRAQTLRKIGYELGIDKVMSSKGSPSTSTSVAVEPKPVKKRVPKTLEEQFIFDLEKNYLMKGVPRGSVCTVCIKPNDLVRCGKCFNYYHLACMKDKSIKPDPAGESKSFTCSDCSQQKIPPCFVCHDQEDTVREDSKFRCVISGCGKQYHLPCLRLFPQHKFNGTSKFSTLFCPNHTCHTCVSDDPRSNATATKGHLIRCIKCPSAYHPEAKCVPAGSQILSYSAMICPKHNLEQSSLNVNWCFLCCKGGSLICCETCPTAFHQECLKFTPPEGKYICEECESGRMPLYNEIVWAKFGAFRFWPAITVPPPMVPDNIELLPHEKWDICVRFFGSFDYVWINRRRIYLYQEGDSDTVGSTRDSIGKRYENALRDAKTVHAILLAKKASEQLTESDDSGFKPPMYVKIKSNRYVAPLKPPYQAKEEMDDSVCECKATDESPCAPESNCINRALLVECNPKVCPAGERCQNQCFEKKQYPALCARRIPQKGWGLVAMEDIRQGQFVIEYVGEVINNEELARRLQHKVAQKDENYYFLTVDSELTIDAGPKGNLARFINHSCEPNCETMLWKVGGAQSVGLFAIKDIKAGEELTFNYNFESKGEEKKICHCNASKCSGFIGQKYRPPLEDLFGNDKKRKQDRKGKAPKRKKSSSSGPRNKRRKSVPAAATIYKDDGKNKRRSRKSISAAVPQVNAEEEEATVNSEPTKSADIKIEGSTCTVGNDAKATVESPLPDEVAIKEKNEPTPSNAE